jgi:hypothetical protein
MRSLLPVLGVVAALAVGCSVTHDSSGSSQQDQTAASATRLLDGQSLSADQLAALATVDATHAAVLFPSTGEPQVRGSIVAGGKVTIVYALNRLPGCRASHDGFEIWDTRIGGEFSNGTRIGEERGTGGDGQPQGTVRGFDSGGEQLGVAHVVPLTLDVPRSAESFFLYAHNTSPPGPSEACDTFDSKFSANFQFKVTPAPPGPASGQVPDGRANVDQLASLVDMGDGSDTAAILFPSGGDPVVRGNLVQGGRVVVAYSLERLSQCRALHDGFPFWVTQVGGHFDDGTKVGGETAPSGGFFTSAADLPGHVVEFVPVPGQESAQAISVPTVFAVPKGATELQLFAHNWNPGGPVDPCSAFDSLGGQNFHFSVRASH